MEKEIVHLLRTVPKGTRIWSIHNQAYMILDEDAIVEINHTICGSEDWVYGEQRQVIFNHPGFVPTVISKGKDEWGFLLSDTTPYEVPGPQFITLVDKMNPRCKECGDELLDGEVGVCPDCDDAREQ